MLQESRRNYGPVVWMVMAMSCAVDASGAPNGLDLMTFLKSSADAFALADGDHDGNLTLDEFVMSSAAASVETAQRQFKLLQGDDRKLNRAEFIRLLWPPDQRVGVMDPIVELEEAALSKWQAILAAADLKNGIAVTPELWPGKQIATEVPEMADVTFDQWDINGDGVVERQEGRRLLELAFGLTQSDGRPIRMADGRVFRWFYFRKLDRDSDGKIDRQEFVLGHNRGRERNAAIFQDLDVNGDGCLTAEETLPLLWSDTISHFFLLDANGDGYMTTDELLAIGWGSSIGRRTLRAFDDDGDGRMSFREFRGTTFANQASDWHALREDADEDGRLSWKEFYREKPPLLIAQSRYFFGQFDVDKDGFLSLAELEFHVDLNRVPTEVAYSALDMNGDGELCLSEFFLEQRPDGRDIRAIDRYEMGYTSAERTFRLNDVDGNGVLSRAEFDNMRRSVLEVARQQADVRQRRRVILQGNYRSRKATAIAIDVLLLILAAILISRRRFAYGMVR
jgi:Ca2+-binding EF-hand superfamily protein